MWIYLLIVIFAIFFVISESNGQDISKKAFAVAIAFLALFVGLGDMLGGYDRYIYGELFDGVADMNKHDNFNVKDAAIVGLYGQEMGYVYFNYFMSFLTKNRYLFILLFTLLMYFNIYKNLQTYTNHYGWALLLFLGFWFFFSFTYLRQVMAVSIAWYSIKYIERRNLLKFLAVIFVAYLFHNSVLILVPMYFVPVAKFEKKTIIIIALVAFALSFLGIAQTLFDSYSEYNAERANISGYSADTGGRWAYLFEAIVLFAIIFTKYDTLFQNRRMAIMTNMAIVFCFVLLAFFRSDNGGRLSWYYMIGVIVTLSNIAYASSFTMKSLVTAICCALYLRVLIAWGSIGILYPYTTFFSNEPRTWDAGWIGWEYDHRYDYDKLYR